ncbi:MAG: putative sulfate exporter family transporter, partial [Oscillospiraceae bacterium]|nr:putative sulfate exporter family transporter [Oscillospiraceae bacterium]
MQFIRKNGIGILLCFALALPCWLLGKAVPVVGAPVFGILLGMALMRFLPARENLRSGIAFTSKRVL